MRDAIALPLLFGLTLSAALAGCAAPLEPDELDPLPALELEVVPEILEVQTVVVRAEADPEVRRVDFLLDDELLLSDDEAPFEATWLVHRAALNGTHTVRALAFDEADAPFEPVEAEVEVALPLPGEPVWRSIEQFSADGDPSAVQQLHALPDNRLMLVGDRGLVPITIQYGPTGQKNWTKIAGGGATHTTLCVGSVEDTIETVGYQWPIWQERVRWSPTGDEVLRDSLAAEPIDTSIQACAWANEALFVTTRYGTLLNIQGPEGLVASHDLEDPITLIPDSLVIDGLGRMTLLARTQRSTGIGSLPLNTLTIANFSPEGELRWLEEHETEINLRTNRAAIGPNDELLVVRAGPEAGLDTASVLTRYTDEGEVEWSFTVAKRLHDLAIDASGRVYIVATSLDPNAAHRFEVFAIDLEGTLVWQVEHEWQAPSALVDSLRLTLGQRGELWIAGVSDTPNLFVAQLGI